MPKNVTFLRNCHGRIHGQILKLNHGLAKSAVLKASSNKYQVGSSVINYLLRKDATMHMRKSSRYILRAKTTRFTSRMHRYKLHADKHYSKGLTDPKPDFSRIPQLKDHGYI